MGNDCDARRFSGSGELANAATRIQRSPNPETRYCRNGTAETDFSATEEDPGQPAKLYIRPRVAKLVSQPKPWNVDLELPYGPREYTVLAVALQ